MTPPASELSEDDKRIWIQLWNTVHNDHYACYYEDLTAESLVGRWRLVDTLTKFATALTASGSSVAAWALWATSKTGSITWAILSGLAALIALVHTSFSISDRMKDDTLIFATFVQ